MATNTCCEHCHTEVGPTDIAEPSAGDHRCKRCGGRALRNRSAIRDVYAAK